MNKRKKKRLNKKDDSTQFDELNCFVFSKVGIDKDIWKIKNEQKKRDVDE